MNRMTGAAHDVLMVDPSLFTLPYDHELCQALAAMGLRVRLVGRPLRAGETTVSPPGYDFDPLYYRRSEAAGEDSKPDTLRFGKGLEHLLDSTRLSRSARRTPPRVVHFQWLPLPWADRPFLAAMARLCPLVLTVHDATARGGRGFAPLQTLGFRGALRHFSALIVHNEAGRRALLDLGVDRASIEILPHPPLPLPPTAAMTEPDFGKPVLLIFGEIKPYKGVDLAIEALAQLPERHRGRTRLVVAGKAHMPVTGLQTLARDLGVESRVQWIDRYLGLDELPALLGSASVFLLPYRESDASGVLAQVLQLGRPIIASNTGSFPELVGAAGCGEVVEPGDATALANAICRLLDDPDLAARMGAAASRLSQTMPGWGEMAKALRAVYERVQTRRPGAGPQGVGRRS
jgi:glycosyltransferase involved in cell wall biosynthesis